jgi:hypothetical protein
VVSSSSSRPDCNRERHKVYDERPRKILLHALESVVVDDAAAAAVVVVVARVARSSSKCSSSSIATTNLPASKLDARAGEGSGGPPPPANPRPPPLPYEQGKSIDKVHRTTKRDRPKLPPRVWTAVSWGSLSEFIFSPFTSR